MSIGRRASSTLTTLLAALVPIFLIVPLITPTEVATASEAGYQVEFDATQGQPAPSPQTVPASGLVTRPTNPQREGYHFDGWFAGGVAYDFSKPVTSPLTLKAGWTPEKNWSMNPDSGDPAGGTRIVLTPLAQDGTRFSKISAGSWRTFGLGSDGDIYAWGDNRDNTLGGDFDNPTTSPVRLKGIPAGTATDIATGDYTTIALTAEGKAWAWGHNDRGQLGDPTKPYGWGKPVPVQLPSDLTLAQVSAGSSHMLALGRDGKIYTWGDNQYGQLGRTDLPTGHGEASALSKTPVEVQGLPSGTVPISISARGNFNILLDSSGRVFTWGSNAHDQLGNPSVPSGSDRDDSWSAAPTEVRGFPEGTKIVSVSAGSEHALALDDQGTVWAWGVNTSGELGNGQSSSSSSSPTRVSMPSGMRCVAISAGYGHSTAIGGDEKVWAWGYGGGGEMGNGTTTTTNRVPVQVQGLPSQVQANSISAGRAHTLALTTSGKVYGWGANGFGQLGGGNRDQAVTVAIETPFPLPQVIDSVTFDGQAGTDLSRRSDGSWTVTTPPHPSGRAVALLHLTRYGASTTTALPYLYTGETAKYQVTFDTGQDGPTVPEQTLEPGQRVTRPNDPVRSGYRFDGWFIGKVAYDFNRSVIGDTTLTARWTGQDGWKMQPAKGPDTGGTRVTLTPPAQRGVRFSQVSAGGSHSLAIGSDGKIYAWGSNAESQLGRTQAEGDSPVPVEVRGFPSGVTPVKVCAGSTHSLALGSDGKIYAWGSNEFGQLGRGDIPTGSSSSTAANPTPTPIQGLASDVTVVDICAGYFHNLLLDSKGRVWAWGKNEQGQLGNTSVPTGDGNAAALSTTPVRVQGLSEDVGVVSISAGNNHNAVLDRSGKAYLWGMNGSGELGNGGTTSSPTAAPLIGLPAGTVLTKILATYGHTTALDSNGRAWTWGFGGSGEMGNGSENRTNPQPLQVPLPSGVVLTDIETGYGFNMAPATDGKTYCWGWNGSGALGVPSIPNDWNDQTSKALTPTTVQGLPENVSLTQVSSGFLFSIAIGSDGQTYSWGRNTENQLGLGAISQTLVLTPTTMPFPGRVDLTSVAFDGRNGIDLKAENDETWTVTTPAHPVGVVDTTIVWKINGIKQDDAILPYEYLSMLPNAGGPGIIVFLVVGGLVMALVSASSWLRRLKR